MASCVSPSPKSPTAFSKGSTVRSRSHATKHGAIDPSNTSKQSSTSSLENSTLAYPHEIARNRIVFGHWWWIEHEPEPFHNGEGFLKELGKNQDDDDGWNKLTGSLGDLLRGGSNHILALNYPSRTGDRKWLVLHVLIPSIRGKKRDLNDREKRSLFNQATIAAIKVHGISPTVLQKRNEGVVDNSLVNQKKVVLIGLGALGSQVAELLVKAGISNFTLCDYDYLETGNVLRHVGGVHEFGATKTAVVEHRILEINPYVEVTRIDESAVKSLEFLRDLMASSDLVISTTADENVEMTINRIAILDQKTVLYGRSLRRGSIGRVFLVRPGKDPCMQCIAHYMEGKLAGEEYPTDLFLVWEEPGEVLFHECGNPVIAGSGMDLSFTATLTARVALDFLQGGIGKSNHWLWSRKTESDINERIKPYSTIVSTIPRREGCPTCEEPEIDAVLLSAEAEETIHEEVSKSVGVETGGILIGYVTETGQAVVLRATPPGTNATKSASIFRRDVVFVQSELDKAGDEWGDQGQYIGEWHCHLELEPKPSATDITSLVGISEAPNYHSRCPVMIIAGTEKETGEITGLFAWAFPPGGRVYPITLNSESKASGDSN
ncbi:MAG TPA: hypothetical protein ENH10_05540 [Bacteroidetes bacterium]|nr:molybdopterin-synthase adenylyltransferase [bacterium BMS3Bbin04]HDO65482.1 hypothetical protein [Bacteroidota bacterium]HEX04607.1 hypothetical protein [Bacteroidota bacterium]